ncbi:MAG: hypothetical protein COB02_02115 [Candidatus Cloacimonadota bacterium]|nr:MAG: hypothetical protein COB02_02115 [Candidatus Cloacimonadota bacterium]
MEVISSTQSFSAHFQVKVSQSTHSSIQNNQNSQVKEESFEASSFSFTKYDSSRLSKEDIQDFFDKSDLQLLNKSLKKYSEEVASKDAIDAKSLKFLHNNMNSQSENKMRQLLKGMQQAEDLEQILFGKKPQNKQVNSLQEQLDFKFEMSFQLNTGKIEKSSQENELSIDVRGRFDQVSNTVLRRRREADPLVFDLNGDGIDTTGIENGVSFDIDGDGKLDQTSFVSKDDFVLALDKNNNGIIDSGKELFGDANGHKDGIEELKDYDSNNDGLINNKDEKFDELRLFNKTHGAISLDQAGISEINLKRIDSKGFTNHGDRYSGALDFTKDGESRQAKDIYFNFRNR